MRWRWPVLGAFALVGAALAVSADGGPPATVWIREGKLNESPPKGPVAWRHDVALRPGEGFLPSAEWSSMYDCGFATVPCDVWWSGPAWRLRCAAWGLVPQHPAVSYAATGRAVPAAGATWHAWSRIVATAHHVADGRRPETIQFLADGSIREHDGAAWALEDRAEGVRLVLRWPDAEAPGRAWIETCVIAADGRSYAGTDQNGVEISGTLDHPPR